MRHLLGPALMLVFGAMVTWLAATALEQYALDRHGMTLAQDAGAKPVLQRTAGEQRMF
jgi:hypothetical protein